MKKWINTQQAAEYLGVKPTVIRSLLRRGELEGRKLPNQEWRTQTSWCDDFMNKGVAYA